ncbi:MAG: hypothetical protein CMB19_02955 [Euryarchaeota archaeon]|nr:hypothetical protein [Euryarchaeota archaeon]
MSGSRRDRNIKVPTRGSKTDRTTSGGHGYSRPAEGRPTVPRPQPKKAAPQPRQNNNRKDGQRRHNNRQGGNRQGGQRNSRPQQKSPLMEETWARVIDHDVTDNVIVAISEEKMLLCRLEPKPGVDPLLTTSRVYIGTDASKRVNIGRVLGMTNLGRVANHVKADLPLVIQIFIEENEKHFIDTFFNRAGNMSLKQHSFELLPGVGNKKALQMVDARGSSGFETLAALNEACNIDAADLLAKRFHTELEDRNIQPRLIDLLLPVKA